MGTGGQGVTLTTHPHLVPIMSRSYTSSPPLPLYGGSGTFLVDSYMICVIESQKYAAIKSVSIVWGPITFDAVVTIYTM
jgi:hypothetical protein